MTFETVYPVGVALTSLFFFILYCRLETFAEGRMHAALTMLLTAFFIFVMSFFWPILLVIALIVGAFYLLTYLVM